MAEEAVEAGTVEADTGDVEAEADTAEKADDSGLSEEERRWGMAAHLSALIGAILPLGNIGGPLAVLLFKGEESDFIDKQAREALNFQISAMIYIIGAGLLTMVLIGFLLLPVIGISVLVLTIMAAVKANNGKSYEYPLTIRMI